MIKAVTEKTPPLTDERLVELALDGDEEAFGLLVRRYQRRLTAFLSQLVGDLELARCLHGLRDDRLLVRSAGGFVGRAVRS